CTVCTIGFSSEISNHLHRLGLRKRPERNCWTFIVTTRGHYPEFSTEISPIGSARTTEQYQRIAILCSNRAGLAVGTFTIKNPPPPGSISIFSGLSARK